MKILSLILMILLISACSSGPVKNPEMLSLSNISVSYIKGESFVMGTYDDAFIDKAPRSVTLDDFYIDKTEVTNASYLQYMSEATGVRKPSFIDDPILGAPELPVVGITHKEAQDFCLFYNKHLPSEAQWEFAAKGGSKFEKYAWGEDENPLYMNFRGSHKGHALAVGSYPPNKYGLYDMSGNVREWVEDSYSKDYYKFACSKHSDEENCFNNPVNTEESKYASNRGGSFDYSAGYPATVSFRFFDLKDSFHKDLGFRCAAKDITDDK